MKQTFIVAEIVPSSMHSTAYNILKIGKGGYRTFKKANKALREKGDKMPVGTVLSVLMIYYKPNKP